MKQTEYVDNITHQGVVEAVDVRKGEVTVRLSGSAECSGCPAARLCSSGKESTDVLVVSSKIAGAFRPGDEVKLVGTEQMHRRAIMIATVLPCVILIAVMVGIYLLTLNQLAACLSGLGSSIVFFVVLYLLRNRIAHEFVFSIVKSK